jgi:hypothetical protein
MKFTTLGRMLTGRYPRTLRGRRRSARCVPAFAAMETRVLPAVSIVIDYTFDAQGFFTQPRRDLMQLAADTIATKLNDSLSAITPGGIDTWSAQFPDPSTGSIRSIDNLNIPANTLIVYVGGGSLANNTEAGLGSTGGYSATGDANWLNTVAARGQLGALATPATDYGPWGGSIRFDNSGATNWYFNQSLAGIGSTQTDFLTVAEHELGHVLGLGTTAAWHADVKNGFFVGPNAEAAFGGQPVPVNPSGDHWANGTHSDGAPALMDPILVTGTRTTYTSLDLAALKDIGWQVQTPVPVVQFSTATTSISETAGSVVITVTRAGGLGPFSVHYATADGTARAGTDYLAASNTLNFAAGDISKTIAVTILNDAVADASETFSLSLSSPTGGAVLGTQSTSTVTVIDNTYRAAGDFDADGRSDVGVFRPSTAQWFVLRSTAGLLSPFPSFGAPNLGDIPLVGDFDGVGHSEIAVFRPSTAQWFVLGPNGGHLLGSFGATNLFDIPVPGDYDGTGHTEMAVFRPSTAQWFVMGPNGGHLLGSFGATNLFDIPVPGDYDGTGHTEMAVFRPSTAQWFVMGPTGGRLLSSFGGPNYFDVPMEGSVASLVKLGVTGASSLRSSSIQAPRGAALNLGLPTASTIQMDPHSSPAVSVRGVDVLSTMAPSSRRRGQSLSPPDVWLTALERLGAEMPGALIEG